MVGFLTIGPRPVSTVHAVNRRSQVEAELCSLDEIRDGLPVALISGWQDDR